MTAAESDGATPVSAKAKGCPTVWSSWSRQYDDGVSNAMDRWYGPRGVGTKENAVYIFEVCGGGAATRAVYSAAPPT